jgi:hypothetical protein
MKYIFDYDCVNPKDSIELETILEYMKPITATTFLKYVDIKEMNIAFRYTKYTRTQLKNDWAVSFHKLKRGNINVYIICESRIEYIFKKNERR